MTLTKREKKLTSRLMFQMIFRYPLSFIILKISEIAKLNFRILYTIYHRFYDISIIACMNIEEVDYLKKSVKLFIKIYFNIRSSVYAYF